MQEKVYELNALSGNKLRFREQQVSGFEIYKNFKIVLSKVLLKNYTLIRR